MRAASIGACIGFGLVGYCFDLGAVTAQQVFTARGITLAPGYRAQENTLDAIMAIVRWNQDHPGEPIAGCEIQLMVTVPDDPLAAVSFVLAHDDNTQGLTGVNSEIRTLAKHEIQTLQIRQTLGGFDYGKPRPYAFFEEVLDKVMTENPPFVLWVDIKDRSYTPLAGRSHTAVFLTEALKKWRSQYLAERNVDIFKYMLFGSTNPFVVEAVNSESKNRGLDLDGLTVMADYSDLGLPHTKFWKRLWGWFWDHAGGYERLFDLSSNWVSIQNDMLTQKRIDRYHSRGQKIIGWGATWSDPSLVGQVDAVENAY